MQEELKYLIKKSTSRFEPMIYSIARGMINNIPFLGTHLSIKS